MEDWLVGLGACLIENGDGVGKMTLRVRNFSHNFSDIVDSYDPKRGYRSYRLSHVRPASEKVLIYENGDSPGFG